MASNEQRASAILFHGMTGHTDELEGIVTRLTAHGINCSVPLLSGHGTSIAELQRTHTEAFLADAEAAWQNAAPAAQGPKIVLGLSFGSILALYLASRYTVDAIVLLSCPLQFHSRRTDLLLTVMSYLPERVLDRLWISSKKERGSDIFVRPRIAYNAHAVGAVARLCKIRRMVAQQAARITAPVLYLHDPKDHHLVANTPALLARLLPNTTIETHLIPGGQHELTIGHRHREVESTILEFLSNTLVLK